MAMTDNNAKANDRQLQLKKYPGLVHEIDTYFDQAAHTYITPSFVWPDFYYTDTPIPLKDQLITKLSNGITGMLEGEAYAMNLPYIEKRDSDLTQVDYLQLPLLAKQTFAHGISMYEILECWNHWIPKENAPERLLGDAVRDQCDILKVGAYQAYAQNKIQIIERSICWAFICAGYPNLAVRYAYLDAYLSIRGDMLEVVRLLTAVIATSFAMSPQAAIQQTVYSMTSSVVGEYQSDKSLEPLDEDASLIDRCMQFIQCVLLTSTADVCYERLKQAKADRIFFIVAGILYRANTLTPADHTYDRLETRLKHCHSFSKQDIAEQLAAYNPVNKEKYAWE